MLPNSENKILFRTAVRGRGGNVLFPDDDQVLHILVSILNFSRLLKKENATGSWFINQIIFIILFCLCCRHEFLVGLADVSEEKSNKNLISGKRINFYFLLID